MEASGQGLPWGHLPALGYVRSGVSQGLTDRQSYAQYLADAHEAGLSTMRRATYATLYAEVRGLRSQVGSAIDAPKDTIHGGLTPQPRGAIQARGYGYWVGISQREVGQTEPLFTRYLIKSNTPLTPSQAEQKAIDYLNTHPDEYDRINLGVFFTGVERYYPITND